MAKHRWQDNGTRIGGAEDTPSGCDEHERVCKICGLVKLTIHAPQGWPYRVFRTPKGIRFDPGYTPVCDGGL